MTKLPDGWHLSTIGEVAEIVRGVTYSKADTLSANDKDAIPLLRATNLEVDSIDFEDLVYVPKRVVKAQQYLKINDIFLAASSGSITVVGKSAQVVKTNGETFGAFCAVIRPKEIHPKYLSYWVQSPEIRDHWSAMAKGTNINNLKASDISGTKIPIPPIDEQHKIVELLEDHLSHLDVALTHVKQAKIKAAQFRRSLLQAGLNGFFNNGPIDEISGFPKTWKLKTLADVADWTSGGTPSSKDSAFYGGDIPWIVIGDLTEEIVLDTEKKITQMGLDSSSAKKLPAGTVMVAMYGASIGRTGVMGVEMTTNQAIACGTPKSEEILGKYLLYFLQSQKNEFIAAGKGGAQPNISQGVVKSWRIPLPPLDEQLEIITEIDSQLEHLDQANRVTETLLKESTGLRRSLLQAAFTGQLTNEVVSV
jgi:type I restriction enzyme S subunit